MFRRYWFFPAVAVLSAGFLFAKTIADYDHTVNFNKYDTYSWIGVYVPESLWQDRVRNAIDNELVAHGWRKVDAFGDASVSAFGSVTESRTLETWYSGGLGGGWYHRGWWIGGGPGFATTTVERVPVGTLHVDIFDASTKKIIWHGDCSDVLTQNPEKNEKKLQRAVADLFKKFPPRPLD
jgi:hypothetical protein